MRAVRSRRDSLAHSGAAFVVTYPLVQNHPDQSAELVGDDPNGLVVSQAGR